MSTRIGTSVGVWNSNQIASLESGFSAFGGRNISVQSDKPFYISRLNFKTIKTSLGITWSEYNKREKLVKKYKEQGVLLSQLNDFYRKFKVRGGGTLEQFDSFVADQRLIAEAKEREEAELLKRLKEEEEKKAISDSNLFPPDETELNQKDPLTDDELKSNYDTKPMIAPKKNNLLIYGVIGFVALVGIVILIKRK